MRVGRITYVNTFPVYGAIDRGVVQLQAELVDGVPTELNRLMSTGALHISVVSAVEYARRSAAYHLLPELAISCDGAVRSVQLFSRFPAEDLTGREVLVSRSSMTSVALLELLFENVWSAAPVFVPGDAELSDVDRIASSPHAARLVIGDAALYMLSQSRRQDPVLSPYPFAYDLGAEWKRWTGLPFVFAVWVSQRSVAAADAWRVHEALLRSREWGLNNLRELSEEASSRTGVGADLCLEYLSGLDYRLSENHFAGLMEFFARLASTGRAPRGSVAFLPAA